MTQMINRLALGLLGLLGLLLLPVLTGCKPATIVQVISPTHMTVSAGQTLAELPEQVEVVYSNDKKGTARVEWIYTQNVRLWEDTIIRGKVAGTDLFVTLPVVIEDPEALVLSELGLSNPDLLSLMENKLDSHPQVELYSISPDSARVCYLYSPNPKDESNHLLYFWQVGESEPSSRTVPITGINFHELEWSADGRFLYAYCSTDAIGSCHIVDASGPKRVTGLATFMKAKWAPAGHVMLIAEPNDVQLVAPVGDGCSFDLLLYDAETGEKTVVLRGKDDSIYTIVGWDGPDTVVYDRQLVKDGTVERDLKVTIPR